MDDVAPPRCTWNMISVGVGGVAQLYTGGQTVSPGKTQFTCVYAVSLFLALTRCGSPFLGWCGWMDCC